LRFLARFWDGKRLEHCVFSPMATTRHYPAHFIHHVGIIPWSAAAIPREDDLLVIPVDELREIVESHL